MVSFWVRDRSIAKRRIDARTNPPPKKNPPSRSQKKQLRVCREQAAWARAEKRTFLRQRLDARLAGLLLRAGDVAGALRILSALASEVKRLDDKLLLVDVHLLESRAHRALRDLPRSRATLTAARAAAASTYVPPAQQAELDAQSGALHADERDYRTAFSYFYEAFDALAPLSGAAASTSSGAAAEGPGAGAGARAPVAETAAAQLTAQHRRGAAAALKHMLLCKVMMGDAAEVPGLVAAKAGSRFAGRDVDALQAVAAAHAARSLSALDKALSDWREELEGESSSSSSSSSSSVFSPLQSSLGTDSHPLSFPLFSLFTPLLSPSLSTPGDDVVKEHVGELHDALLRRNLLKLVEPYSRVEVSHLAKKLDLPVGAVVSKLSEMILDGAVDATLDAGAGCLEVFEGDDARGGYAAALEAVEGLGAAVDALFARSRKLSAAAS